ncbi:PaaI family thioesterase [Angustibacter aerolatus]
MSTPSDTSSLGAVGEAIGIRFDDPTGARVEATWTVGPAVHQPAGILHGGVHSWVVETLASVGAQTWLGDDGHVVGVNNSTDFYRAVRDGELRSVATPVHQGRSQQVWLVETRDAGDRLVARGQVRLQNLRGA